MSNLLDKASILLTPTAYNDGGMLSVKPENGDGDFTFSRSSAATRVNAQGLVENVQIISSELVSNGNFSQIGTEEVSNGNFSQEGSELVTNGDFATDSDWLFGGSASISNGSANFTGSGDLIRQNTITPVGTYKVTFTVTGTGYLVVKNWTGGVSYREYSNISEGEHTIYIEKNEDGIMFQSFGFASSIDNVSVKEVGQNWNLGSGWSIGDGVASCDGTQTSLSILRQNSVFTSGKTYQIQLDVTSYTSGSLEVSLHSVWSSSITSVGTYTFFINATIDWLKIQADANFIGSVTNISVKEVGQDWTFVGDFETDGTKAVISNASQYSQVTSQQGSTFLKNGKKYKLEADITISINNALAYRAQGGAIIPISTSDIVGGKYTSYFTMTQDGYFWFQTTGAYNGLNASITNISLKEITDDTNIPRINYEGFSYQDTLGSELVVNGDFSNGTNNWTPNAAATLSIDNGKLKVLINGTSGYPGQFVDTIIGKTYKVTADGFIGTSSRIALYNDADGQFRNLYADGNFNFNFIATSTSTQLRLYVFDNGAYGLWDNVSVKEVTGQEVVPDSGCGSWLLEPQSTNLIPYSEDFSQWQTLGISGSTTVTYVSDLVNPDGSIGGYKVSGEGVYLNLSLVAGTEKNIYARTVSGTGTAQLLSHNSNTNNTFNLTEDWQRFDLNYTSNIPTSFYVDLRGASTTLTELYVWGANATNDQDYPTSYIPTNGATNTRLQDIATNSGNSSLINSTEGVLYAEIAALADDLTNRYITISDSSNSNYIRLTYTTTSNQLGARYYVNGSFQCALTYILTDSTEFIKVAFKYKENDFALWVDGTEVATDNSGNVNPENTFHRLDFRRQDGFLPFYGKVKALAVYKEALTDAELQSLTTI